MPTPSNTGAILPMHKLPVTMRRQSGEISTSGTNPWPKLLRLIIARAGHNRSFRRRLPRDLGRLRFPASLEGGAKYLRLNVEAIDPMLLRFAREFVRSGCTVWDIGANVGLFSFAAAARAGETGMVLAVEADVWLVNNLRKAARWNASSARVVVVAAAAAEQCGIAEFTVAKANRAASYLSSTCGSSVTGGVREVHHVPTVTLDALARCFPLPDVLKIDVEGEEVAVLNGARNVLAHRPVILLEVSAASRSSVAEALAKYGYRYWDAESGMRVTLPTFNTIAIADS
jgi:FkbM family methyltransferase